MLKKKRLGRRKRRCGKWRGRDLLLGGCAALIMRKSCTAELQSSRPTMMISRKNMMGWRVN